MKRIVLLVIGLVALRTTAATAQVSVGFGVGVGRRPVSGYIVVGNRFGYAPRPVLVEVVRPYGYRGWYRAYRPYARYERVRVYRPAHRVHRCWR
jgi:hypothetical protein